MKKIKSIHDAENSGLAPEVASLAKHLVEDLMRIYTDEIGKEWEPEDDGYVLVVEPDDDPDSPELLEVLGRPLFEAYLEGVTKEEGCYVTCQLWDNDAGLTIILPDHPDLDPRVREKMEAELIASGGEDG